MCASLMNRLRAYADAALTASGWRKWTTVRHQAPVVGPLMRLTSMESTRVVSRCNLPEQLPDRKALHQYFTSAILLDLAELERDLPPEQVLQPELAAYALNVTAKLSNYQQAYRTILLQYELPSADLQRVITSSTSAVLRISNSLEGPMGKRLVQQAYTAVEEVHITIGSYQRCKQLLQLAHQVLHENVSWQEACAAAVTPGGCSSTVAHPLHWQTALQQCQSTNVEHLSSAMVDFVDDHNTDVGLLGQSAIVQWF